MRERDIIFIIDDSTLILEVVSDILSPEYIVFTATSGEKMFNLMEKVTPSLILLDIEMPVMDGHEAIKLLKSDEKTAQIPIIFLTASANEQSEQRALSLGAVDYITKPFSASVLQARIGLHLNLQKQKRELRESARAAKIASNAKSSFLAMMSHEMRTPLNAIIGLSELSLEIDDMTDELYTNLTNIRNAGSGLLSIISDILDISKIETSKLELNPTDYELATSLNDALIQSALHGIDKKIEFRLTIDSNVPARLFGDELRVKQILINLLSNAYKYTDTGIISLAISCVHEADDVIMRAEISDSGKGILKEHLDNVFEDFFQVDMATSRSVMGTGLGLPIARRLARMMSGEIKAKSIIGKGSTFTAWIRQRVVSADFISPNVIAALQQLNYTDDRRTRKAATPQFLLPYVRVLVVDDVPTNLAVAAGMLKRYRIKTDCVASGQEAIDAMERTDVKYNAIFMDHLMPGMDGVEATAQIRAMPNEYAQTIPIIALTANATVGNEEMFLYSGFQAYISKPIELPKLDSVLRDWLYNEQMEKCYRIEGLDFGSGMERFDGDARTYFNIMRTFVSHTLPILSELEVVTEANLRAYMVQVHGIKGSASGIMAGEVTAAAAALEEAAKTDNLAYIQANNAPFLSLTHKLVSDIDRLLQEIFPVRNKRTADKPDERRLMRVLSACAQHDMIEIDNAIDALDAYEYTSGGELIKWMKEMADEMNYDDIENKLREMLTPA